MASTNGDVTPPSLKTARLMVEMIKLSDQMRRMSYDNEEMMERMRKSGIRKENRKNKCHNVGRLISWGWFATKNRILW